QGLGEEGPGATRILLGEGRRGTKERTAGAAFTFSRMGDGRHGETSGVRGAHRASPSSRHRGAAQVSPPGSPAPPSPPSTPLHEGSIRSGRVPRRSHARSPAPRGPDDGAKPAGRSRAGGDAPRPQGGAPPPICPPRRRRLLESSPR